MLTVKEIETEVARFSWEELAQFRAWFNEFDDRTCDRQSESDAGSGKLDELIEKPLNVKDFHP
jgi:hypothetical protein